MPRTGLRNKDTRIVRGFSVALDTELDFNVAYAAAVSVLNGKRADVTLAV